MTAKLRVTAAVVVALVVAGTWLVPVRAEASSKPSARSVSSKVVTVNGGVTLTVRGTNLNRVTAMLFGAAKTTRITHLSKSRLRVVAPAHRAGTVRLKLKVGSRTYTTRLTVRYREEASGPSATESAVLAATNAARTAGYTCTDAASGASKVMPAVAALAWNGRLATAARGHSSDMAAHDYFSHTSRDGTTFTTRITRAGYAWSAAGENIAAGYPTAAAVVDGWLSSYGHCLNLMSGDFVDLGVGFASGASFGSYWTQDFGRPQK